MKTLLVDDEILAIEGTLSVINWEKLGIHTVFSANSFDEAKTVFETNGVDILICDIEMPQRSGIDLLHWVRENHSETEVIFLTAHADFKYAQQAIQLGCLDYLLKPIESEILEKILDKAITKINLK